MNVSDMVKARLKAYVLIGAMEPALDIAAPGVVECLKQAESVVALTPYATAKDYASVILPIGSYFETAGTYVNLEGRWQSVGGAAKPVGDARPGWKVLRVLGNLLNLPNFDYETSEQVRDELKSKLHAVQPDNRYQRHEPIALLGASTNSVDIGIYAIDPIVRRATSLQETRDAREGVMRP